MTTTLEEQVAPPTSCWDTLPLLPHHVVKLRDESGITSVVAKEKELRSASTVEELPEWAQSWGEQAIPAIVFPWHTLDGNVVEQIRPDNVIVYGSEEYKYLWPKGAGAVLNAIRHDENAETILIVEGTKQGLAAASWAPEGVAIYGVGGCRNWSQDGIPLGDLEVADGKNVVVALDADVSSNRDVYDAAVKIGQAVKADGALSVVYLRLPAGGTNGIDDVLAKKSEDRRTQLIANLIEQAHPSKPCDAKPKPKARSVSSVLPLPTPSEGGSERPMIFVDGDRYEVINDMTRVLLDRWNATRLFCHGEVISQLVDDDGPKMKPLTEGSFFDILQETAATAKRVTNTEGQQIGVSYTWPDPQSVKATMSRATRFAQLDLIARSPFVRADGSVCLANGYDMPSRTMVVMDEALARIDVPEHPTPEQVETARKLLLEEWLGDFPFPDATNQANVLALILTPFVRSMMDIVPLAVVDAHTPGTGKNLLVDVILLMFLGERPDLLAFNTDDEEFRKSLTAAFRAGSEVLVFDEAHHLDGASLARALTAPYWRDRGLGGNQMLGFPNRVTWIALGNNVRVEGDIFRRVYRIALRSPYDNPSDRPEEDFRNADLKAWTEQNRPQLLRAAMTLIRAWFSAGQPKPREGVAFGSFEKWARVLGGIVETAGQPGFLGNLKTWRSESNFNTAYWEGHLRWVYDTFGAAEFTTNEVRIKLTNETDPDFPPVKGDPSEKTTFPKVLGEAYAKIRDRSFGGMRIRRPVNVDGKPKVNRTGRAVWVVEGPSEADPVEESLAPPAETTDTTETPDTFTYTGKNSFSTCSACDDEKKCFAHRAGSSEGLCGLGSVSTDSTPAVTEPSGAVPTARPAPSPTPPVKQSAVLPRDWANLFAVDTPPLSPALCAECGTEKVPDVEMSYFLLCPSCTSGSLRPLATEEV